MGDRPSDHSTQLADIFQKNMGLRPAQATAAVVMLRAALMSAASLDDVLKRKEDILGRWELTHVKPFMGSGTQSTFERYEFRKNLTYGYFMTTVRSYVAGPFAPDAGSSYWSGPNSSHIPDNEWNETGKFLPAQLDGKGGFTLLLFPDDSDDFRDLHVHRWPTGLEIGNVVFKRG